MYSEEGKQILKRSVEQDRDSLGIIHKSVERPHLQYPPPPDYDSSMFNLYAAYDAIYLNIPWLIAWEGLDALLDGNHETLDRSINTLQRLAMLFSNRSLLDGCLSTEHDNFLFARLASRVLALLVENALNRTVVPAELLLRWQTQFSAPEYTSSDSIIKALISANVTCFYAYVRSREEAATTTWEPLSNLLKWSGISTYYYERLAPDMSRYILKLSQTKEDNLLVLANEIQDIRFNRLYGRYELENFRADWWAIYMFNSLKSYTALTRSGIALYLYSQNHGTFPDTLEALVPEYLDAVPINPFTRDEPLQYRHEDDRVVLFIEQYDWSFTLLKSILQKEPAVTTQEQSS